MVRKIYKFIEEWIVENDFLHFVGGIIIGIILCIFIFLSIDSTPATNNDYAPLVTQQKQISKDFNIIYSYDNYQITPSKDNIQVILSNKECRLICTYDKNFKFVSSEKYDKAFPKLIALLVSILFSLILAYFAVAIFFILFPAVIILLLKLIEKICRLLL